ncbi:uncharacterized protein [Petaurus breviceps papuanus]|uniref:uncharacterized protein n=1 Tax=Petaurus breviceps papuanus TaxID=3040969 RepID=UPI0036DD2FB7
MNYRNNLDSDRSPGSRSTDNSQISLLRNLDLQLGCVRSVQCPRCRDRRRNARCQSWIEECPNAYAIAQDRDRDLNQNQDRDRDLDGDGDGDLDGDGDGDGDSSTWWIQYPSGVGHCYIQRSSLSYECPRTRQLEAFGWQWLPPLELALDVTAVLALLSLLVGENFEMLLPPSVLFVFYLLLTTPLAMVLGCGRRSRNQTWNQF